MSDLQGNDSAFLNTGEPLQGVPANRPAGVYMIALFFTAVWLFSMGSLVYVLFFKLTPEMRRQITATAALAPLAIADMNGLLMVVASWLLVALRRVGASLMLVSTLLLAVLVAISWPALLTRYAAHPSPALLRPLLLGGSNLVLHAAATIYAFRLSRRGLLR